jgi:phage tail-like protein
MTVLGVNRVYHKKYKFLVEIDQVVVAGFQKCSGLAAEVAVTEQYEGGSLTPNKSPGRIKYSDVTLERGATDDLDLFNWFKQVVDAVAGIGEDDPIYKRNMTIVQQSRSGKRIRQWRITQAWPTKFAPGEWDNTSDENVMESVTITYESFDLVQTA